MSGTNGHPNGNSELAKARAQAVPNRVKEKLAKGQLSHAFSIKMIDNVEVVGFAAVAGFDAVLIDLEHSSFGIREANQLSCMALSCG
jgi:2-keto-3-deoxy-L-rhamnonate aldolase RhmA